MNEIGSVLDTDVLLKVAAFRLGNELLGILRGRGGIGALKVAHLIAASQLSKNPRIRARDDAQRELQSMLENLTALEPDNAEIEIAAELAEAALLQGLPLDAGEAQIAAIGIVRALPLLITGDKRAIAALEQVLVTVGRTGALQERVACLEQLLKVLSTELGCEALRHRVCAEPDVDGAARLAFSCHDVNAAVEQVEAALDSFIRDVRSRAPSLLVRDSALA